MVTVETRVDLSVSLGPLTLPSPITLASGTCGYGMDLTEFVDLKALGGVFTKGLTYLPRQGNPSERLAETASGMLNRIGLQNVGVEAFLADKLPPLLAYGMPVIANVAGASQDEYLAIVERLSQVPGLAGIEVNVSCPNVDRGGLEFGTEPRILERLVAAIRHRTSLPLIVKLTPNVTAVGDLAKAAESGGADVLSAINTVKGIAVRPQVVEGRLASTLLSGGLSGPAIKPVALRCVWEIRQACSLPIIGVGGIRSVTDIVEFLAVGASAIQIGTATFLEPGLADRLRRDLADWMEQHGVRRLSTLLPARGAV